MDATAHGRESRLSNLDGQGKEEEGSVKDWLFPIPISTSKYLVPCYLEPIGSNGGRLEA